MILDNKDYIATLSFALDNVSAYIYIKDINFRYVYANKLTLDLFSCDKDFLVGKLDEEFFPQKTVEELRKIDKKVLLGKQTEEEVEVIDKNGKLSVYLEKKTPIYDNDNKKKIIGILGISTDITTRKILENELKEAAMLDFLTQTYNRRYIVEEINHAMSRSSRQNYNCALLFVDLNDFKVINDTYGHSFGDEVLKEVAQRLKNTLRKTDTCARYGGDEFLVLLENLNISAKQAQIEVNQIVKKIQESFKNRFTYKNKDYEISLSIGSATFKGKDKTLEEILQNADKNMYENKEIK